MEAIKTYYRAQRPHDCDANLWDNAIDLLLADNPDSSLVGRTILEANGADMFVADFYTKSEKCKKPGMVMRNGERFIHLSFKTSEIFITKKVSIIVAEFKFINDFSVIECLINNMHKIKSALGLQ